MSVLDLGLGLAISLAGLVGLAIGHRRQPGPVGAGGLRRRVAASGDAGSVMDPAASHGVLKAMMSDVWGGSASPGPDLRIFTTQLTCVF